MDGRTIDPELRLIPYYPDYVTTLPWYQDLSLCKQVDNRDAEIYSFNTQSQAMFQSVGFVQTEPERYFLRI